MADATQVSEPLGCTVMNPAHWQVLGTMGHTGWAASLVTKS